MRKIELFKRDNINLNKIIEGKVINKIEYSENIPLEDNCIKIIFSDDSYFLVYALMRIIYNGQIILCSADYYFDKNFIENVTVKPITDTLIYNSLIEANNLLSNKEIEQVTINNYGDLVIDIKTKVRIEIYFDTPEDDKDYYAYFGDNETYFLFCKSENQLTVIEDIND